MLIIKLFQVRPEGPRESRNEVGFQGLADHISGIRAEGLPIVTIACYPTVSISPEVY